MNSMKFTHTSSLRGELTVPGDKSISHRSVMFGALADGLTEIHGFLQGADCLSTISCFSKMGISIENQGETVLVHGRGLHGLTAPDSVLDCGNSGTTTRLISGILSTQKFDTTLTGDASIQKRPMKRIIDPLSQMGAKIESVNGNGCAPLHITGSPLHGIHYNSPVASAQVKSSILLAGLYADGETRVTEPYISRDHSERMLSAFGADIHTEGTTAILQPAKQLYGQKILVPGDISSAAFFIAAGLIVPDSEILIKNVGINPTRDGTCRLGAWVRDNMQGIGTLTFVEPDGTFAALGHGISDVDTGKMLQLNGGELYLTQILSVIPGKAGVPGELQGVIHYEEKNRIGSVAENTIYGIHGVLDREKSSALPLTVTEIAYRQEIETGPATVRMCVDNTVEEYEAEITEIDLGSENTNKNFVLEITDQRLLQKTGGIVQGNSGSPVLQNGRLIGAITHVFVNHPEKGYGVFAENMLARN